MPTTGAALSAPAAGAWAYELQCAALLLYAAQTRRLTAPEEAARLREAADGIAWYCHQRDSESLRRPNPRQFETRYFKEPPDGSAATGTAKP